MGQIAWETIIDPEKDLSKLDEKELAKRESIMDEQKNQKDDSNSVYDIKTEFL